MATQVDWRRVGVRDFAERRRLIQRYALIPNRSRPKPEPDENQKRKEDEAQRRPHWDLRGTHCPIPSYAACQHSRATAAGVAGR